MDDKCKNCPFMIVCNGGITVEKWLKYEVECPLEELKKTPSRRLDSPVAIVRYFQEVYGLNIASYDTLLKAAKEGVIPAYTKEIEQFTTCDLFGWPDIAYELKCSKPYAKTLPIPTDEPKVGNKKWSTTNSVYHWIGHTEIPYFVERRESGVYTAVSAYW